MAMIHDIKIVEMIPKHHQAILDLAELLSEWFDDKARDRYITLDLKLHQGYVALSRDRLLGFVTLTSKTGDGIISWIGVHPDHHRQGIGRRLLETAERHFRSLGCRRITVETVGWSDPEYPPYEKTRAFYGGMKYLVSRNLESGEEAGYRWQMIEYSKVLG